MSGIETNPDPSTFPTIGDTLKWLEKLQKEGKLSEEKLKNQAEIFFNGEIKEDKKVVKKKNPLQEYLWWRHPLFGNQRCSCGCKTVLSHVSFPPQEIDP